LADAPPFQVIFCRNVMIYFDQPTKDRLVARLAEALCPGGFSTSAIPSAFRAGRSPARTGWPHDLSQERTVTIRVLIIDDSATMRAVLAARLSGTPDIQVVGLANNAAEGAP
jgi:hypothetical protein